jgi:hypothetical protein
MEEGWSPNSLVRWWGGQNAANGWGIVNRDLQPISVEYRGCCPTAGLLYAAGKAFFSLWKTS